MRSKRESVIIAEMFRLKQLKKIRYSNISMNMI